MKPSWSWLGQLMRWTNRRRPIVRCRPTTRPCLEHLEDRIVPTVAYEPYFGAESMTYKGGPVLNDAPVYLIFWGSYWNTQGGSTSETDLISAINKEFNSSAFDNLSQYKDNSGRTAGPAYIGGYWTATEDSDPTSGFSDSTLQQVVSDAISDDKSPILTPEGIEAQDGGQAPIYLVITPPNIHSSRGSNTFGYHSNYSDSNVSSQSLVYAWCGTDLVGYYDTQDDSTLIVSHEIGEALSDPYIQTNPGWMAYAGASYPVGTAANPDEIGDFEPEYENPNGESYSYRVNGTLVQALWDKNAGAFTVPDRNVQTFYVYPQYHHDSSTGTYDYVGNDLDIYGDQFGSGYNNNITVNTDVYGGLTVTLNNESVTFEDGQITSLYIYTGTGTDNVSILSTPSGMPTYVYCAGQNDTVTVGNSVGHEGNGDGFLGDIGGSIDVYGSGAAHLNIDDSGDASTQTVTMEDGKIYYGNAAPISWTPTSSSTGGVTYLGVYGGSAGNSFNVYNTSNLFDYTYLNTGIGNDSVFLYATSSGLDIYNPGGQDYTSIGSSYGTSNINGYYVYVYGAGSTQLIVNDSLDSTSRTVSMYDGHLSGLSPADIYWSPTSSSTGGVTSLGVFGGRGGNTFNIYNTSNLYDRTLLDTGSGNDTVNIYGTTGRLDDDNPGGTDTTNVGLGNMSGISGSVDAYGDGSTYLYLEDANDTTARTVTMNDGSITGLAPAAIDWTPSSSSAGGVTYLSVYGSSAGSTYNVNNTSNFYYWTSLQTGGGNDTVNISATKSALYDDNTGGADSADVGLGSVAGINGLVSVYGAGTIAMIADDRLDSTARTATLTSSQLTGLGNTGTIYYGSGVTSLTLKGGSKGSTYNIQSTSSTTPVTLNGGGASDTFNVSDSSNTLNGIQGAVTINGGGGANTLNANDQGSSTGQSYTLSKTALTRSGVAAITYSYLSRLNLNASGSDTLTLLAPVPTVATVFNAGSGSNTLHGANVANTWTINAANAGKVGQVSLANVQNLIGGTSTDTFKFTGSGSLAGTVQGGGGSTNKLDYSGYTAGAVTVNLQNSSATSINGGAAGGFSGISSLAGNSNTASKLIGPNGTNLWTITGTNAGKVNSFAFTGMPNLVGGTGLDVFKLSNATNSKVKSIVGGGAPAGQGDWLDYSSFSSSSTVNVNLATGSASNINGGAVSAVSGIQNVIGSSTGHNNLTGDSQGNILIGGSGTSTNRQVNTLTGGNGRSLFIGGGGGGGVTGGSGEDILIAGTTSFNPATTSGKLALMSILYEWQRTDKTFAQRVTDLKSGGGYNGSDKLIWSGTGTTVHKSLGSFALKGDPAEATTADWFFANLSGTGALSTISDFDDETGETDQLN